MPNACKTVKPTHLYSLSSSEEQTTDTELSAIAADPIHGCSLMPHGLKTPAATGMPTRL